MLTKVKGQLTAAAMRRYELTDDDCYIVQDEFGDKVILKRQGVDKVAKKIHMTVRFDSIQTVPYGNAVCTTIVATGRCGEFTDQKIASANPDNCLNSKYYAETAEKRVRHRLLLSLADLYEHGVFSEEESDKWQESKNKYKSAVEGVEKALGLSKNIHAETDAKK